jgi:hypothetical protein
MNNNILNEHSIDTTIDEIIRSNKNHRFASELNNTTNINKKNNIQEILDLLNGNIYDNKNNEINKMNEIYDKINENNLKNKWEKLSIPQKHSRVDLFLDENIKL